MFETSELQNGYRLIRKRFSRELGGTLWEMEYVKTGTPVVWMDSGNRNKVFAVTFRTLPSDSTGVFHVLEHAMLCGSRKYPVKEPFVELLKGSMNTYLNAMTFSDRTTYPVGSRNLRDFENLVGVYLDAVFDPLLLENKNIFLQEGWHLEEGEDGLRFNGVVYNEMKGAMSEVEDFISEKILSLIFPDNAYGFLSGGDPEHITDLTYEQFTEAYRRHYHPSNAVIYLDGDMPLEEILELCDGYLSRYEKADPVPQTEPQVPRDMEATAFYDLEEDEDDRDKGHLTLGRILCGHGDAVKPTAVSILADVMLGSNESPLKKELMSSGLCMDCGISVDDEVAQPYVTVDFRNVTDGREEEIRRRFRDYCVRTAAEGLDREALEASISRLEFSMRQKSEPQGLDRCGDALCGLMFGEDPLKYMEFDPLFRELRSLTEGGGFEKILLEVFGAEKDWAVLHTLPSRTWGEEKQRREEERIRRMTAGWTEREHVENRGICEGLRQWQETPDSPEAAASIPFLPLSEIDPEPEYTPTEVSDADGVRILHHPLKCGGILYTTLIFDLTGMEAEEMAVLNRMRGVFTDLPTTQHDVLKLQQAVKRELGSLTFGMDVLSHRNDTEKCVPYFVVKMSALEDRFEAAQRLAEEILFTADFSDHARVKDYLIQANEALRQSPLARGHVLGTNCALSHYSSEGALRSWLGGFAGISAFRELASSEDGPERVERIIGKLRREYLVKERLTVSVTSDERRIPERILSHMVKGGPYESGASYRTLLPHDAGYRIPSSIGYSAQGFDLSQIGFPFHASLRVAANVIALDYLWNEVRALGGAYDTSVNVSRRGTLCTYSYRDPDPFASLETNRGIGEFLREFCASGEELDGYILSAVNATEPLAAPAVLGGMADTEWLCGYTREDDDLDRRQMLETTMEDILATVPVWEAMAENGARAVVAGAEVFGEGSGFEMISR